MIKFTGGLLKALIKKANMIRIKQILPLTIATQEVFLIPFPNGFGYYIANEVQTIATKRDNANNV